MRSQVPKSKSKSTKVVKTAPKIASKTTSKTSPVSKRSKSSGKFVSESKRGTSEETFEKTARKSSVKGKTSERTAYERTVGKATGKIPSKTIRRAATVSSTKPKSAKAKPKSAKVSLEDVEPLTTKIFLPGVNAIQLLLSGCITGSGESSLNTMNLLGAPQSLGSIEGREGGHATMILSENPSESVDERSTYFLDEHKNLVQYWPTMIDHSSGRYGDASTSLAMGAHTKLNCWWDRHPIADLPLGCPLRYHSGGTPPYNIALKRYLKSINVGYEASDELDLYEVEGVFCSPECVKAYVLNESKSIKYQESLVLLKSLYLTLTRDVKESSSPPEQKYAKRSTTRGTREVKDFESEKATSRVLESERATSRVLEPERATSRVLEPERATSRVLEPEITPAPSWRLLKAYGGHLTIQAFRSSFHRLRYGETVNVKRPYMYYLCDYFKEEKIK